MNRSRAVCGTPPETPRLLYRKLRSEVVGLGYNTSYRSPLEKHKENR